MERVSSRIVPGGEGGIVSRFAIAVAAAFGYAAVAQHPKLPKPRDMFKFVLSILAQVCSAIRYRIGGGAAFLSFVVIRRTREMAANARYILFSSLGTMSTIRALTKTYRSVTMAVGDNMALIVTMAMGGRYSMAVAGRVLAGAEFEGMLAGVFRRAGWRVHHGLRGSDREADLIVDADQRKYLIELKVSSEGRRDRLIPLLSQAILQAQAFAQGSSEPVVPIAVVAARHIPGSVAEQIKQFGLRYAPNVGVGVIDAEGLRSFAGYGLEELDAKPPRRLARYIVSPHRLPELFSDLNQWMLKILLGQCLPDALISVPREPIRNAFQLAAVARVSVMSASRFVNQLENEGFLDKDGDHLQIVRADELLERWISRDRQMVRDIPVRWIIKNSEKELFGSLAKYVAECKAEPALKAKARSVRVTKTPPRCCIGVFAAADALGVGFVQGVPPHLYLERLDLDVLGKLGLSVEDAARHTDVYVRVPSNKESVFRAAVIRAGLPVSDVLQVWLDASAHPSRGREQADEIWRRVLKPLFGRHR
jgi:hypothetical protein